MGIMSSPKREQCANSSVRCAPKCIETETLHSPPFQIWDRRIAEKQRQYNKVMILRRMKCVHNYATDVALLAITVDFVHVAARATQ